MLHLTLLRIDNLLGDLFEEVVDVVVSWGGRRCRGSCRILGNCRLRDGG